MSLLTYLLTSIPHRVAGDFHLPALRRESCSNLACSELCLSAAKPVTQDSLDRLELGGVDERVAGRVEKRQEQGGVVASVKVCHSYPHLDEDEQEMMR